MNARRIIHAKVHAEKTICGLRRPELKTGTRIAEGWRMCKRCGKAGGVALWLDENRRVTSVQLSRATTGTANTIHFVYQRIENPEPACGPLPHKGSDNG